MVNTERGAAAAAGDAFHVGVAAGVRRSVVTIGNFDGVHRGHVAVLAAARQLAGTDPVVVVTFEPHPLQILRPDRAPAILTPLAEKTRLLLAAGADEVVVLPFDAALAALPAVDFVTSVLVDRLHARVVVVGENFRFGYRATGDLELLQSLGAAGGFAVVPAELVLAPGGARVSSSLVRERLAAGDIAAVTTALGRPPRILGVVVHGEARGRELGYPTANLDVTAGVQGVVAIPADGVYAVRLLRAAELGVPELGAADLRSSALGAAGPGAGAGPGMPGTLSVGTNPTFDGVERRVEVYVLDRDDLDLYGEHVAVDVVAWQRPTLRFDSVDELVTQMAVDVAITRDVLDAGVSSPGQAL